MGNASVCAEHISCPEGPWPPGETKVALVLLPSSKTICYTVQSKPGAVPHSDPKGPEPALFHGLCWCGVPAPATVPSTVSPFLLQASGT